MNQINKYTRFSVIYSDIGCNGKGSFLYRLALTITRWLYHRSQVWNVIKQIEENS